MDKKRNEDSTPLPGADDAPGGPATQLPKTRPPAATAPLPDWIAGFARLPLRS